FEATVDLLLRSVKGDHGRLLAFGDSRKMVEQIVAACHRASGGADPVVSEGESEPCAEAQSSPPETTHFSGRSILPYRAGYEEEDRLAIQKALTEGTLGAVVSTSALELGL